MLGFFTENGPFAVSSAGADGGQPVLTARNTSWHLAGANVVFLEAPVGVGLSYADNPSVDYHINDTSNAQDNLGAVLDFFVGWPEWRNNSLFLSGESYGGVYVPTLAYAIVQHNAKVPPVERLSLQGIAVGNGCSGTEIGTCANNNDDSAQALHLEFFRGQALVSSALYAAIQEECKGNYNHPTAQCVKLLTDMHYQIGPVDVYNVIGTCASPPAQDGSSSLDDLSAAPAWEFATGTRRWRRARPQTPLEQRIGEELLKRYTAEGTAVDALGGVKPGPGPIECIGDGEQGPYLDRGDVRAALHVAPVSSIGHWHSCVEKQDWFYTSTEQNEPRDIYPTLLKVLNRTLIYSGQADGCVPWTDSEAWTSGMGLPTVQDGAWHPWYTSQQQVGGYVTEYTNGFTFLTVTGAGHMVPQFTPNKAFDMFSRFIKDHKY